MTLCKSCFFCQDPRLTHLLLPHTFRQFQYNISNSVGGGSGGGGGSGSGGGSSSSPNPIPSAGNFLSSLQSALIFMSQIIVATVIIFLLFKYNCTKILYLILGLIVLALFGLFGWILISNIVFVYNVVLDYITLVFVLWNLSVVGIIAMFYNGPGTLNQGYLIVVSSLMAYSLSQIDALTTWILLSLLVVWDLVAVLCPYGPLRLLVNEAKRTDREIPALLYSVMVWMMASDPRHESIAVGGDPSPADDLPAASGDTSSIAPLNPNSNGQIIEANNNIASETDGPVGTADDDDVSSDEDDEKSNLKLGLGDFVFYSVLISRAGKGF